VLEIRERLELRRLELGAIKAFFDVLGIPVGIREEILDLDLVILPAFGFSSTSGGNKCPRYGPCGYDGAPLDAKSRGGKKRSLIA
jgi:hypothetical protein